MDEIIVTLKLYSGIHREINLSSYDQSKGIIFNVRSGTRLKKVLKIAGFSKPSRYVYFSEGIRISIWRKLKYSCEISCLKQSGGG